MRSARSATGFSSTRRAISTGWSGRCASSRSACRWRRAALKLVLREVVRRTACATGWSTCRSRAAWRAAIMPFRPTDTPPALVVTAKSIARAKGDARAAEGVAVITLPDNRWERVDIKIVGAPAERDRQAEGEGGGRPRGLVRRPRRLRHGRLLHHRLDRDQGRRARHSPERHGHPARRHPRDGDRGRSPRRASRSRSGSSRWRRPRRRARRS